MFLLAFPLVTATTLWFSSRGSAHRGASHRRRPPVFRVRTSDTRSSVRKASVKGVANRSGCRAPGCHEHLSEIRPPESEMMQGIREIGITLGDPEGCIVCHGGDPSAETLSEAHRGAPRKLAEQGGLSRFVADPGSPWVNAKTCGLCHADLVQAQWRSLMMTEAGKIQGTAWAFGGLTGYRSRWGNYAVSNPPNPEQRRGTSAYRRIMAAKAQANPDVFPARLEALPDAPNAKALGDIRRRPSLAAFTYLRSECQRCHLGVKGRHKRGDWRGMGCSACHIPYSNEGYYEGPDGSISHDAPGHMLVHSMQSGRSSPVQVGKVRYSGMPVETCTTCHNRGKRIGVSFEGLMESAFASPYAPGGRGQVRLHTKTYISMPSDVHARKGMTCQDCHTTNDVHGDGFLAGANLGSVEIECTDCHGTPRAYPWELPLGFGDENRRAAADGPARGTAGSLPPFLEHARHFPAEDGYLLTARGNPMPEVVRRGDKVVVHTAAGKDLVVEPLKSKLEHNTLNTLAKTAMERVSRHIERMECYACHASWAPQCYGCHVKVDYSRRIESFDWVAAGRRHASSPQARTQKGEPWADTTLPGHVQESRSYMRWEDPALGNNGEGRVTPLIPGCQVSVTILDRDGGEVLRNHIFRTPPGTEGSGPEGQLSLDMSPVQPHTTTVHARTCESCHGSAKAMGYGIGGRNGGPSWAGPRIVDLQTVDGQTIPGRSRPQVESVAGLISDWSAVVTPEGRQLQTVGHHFKGSGPLDADQRARLDRRNVCVACHKEIPDGSVAIWFLNFGAKTLHALPRSNEEHESLLHRSILLAAWVEIGLGLLAGLAAVLGLVWWIRRRRKA